MPHRRPAGTDGRRISARWRGGWMRWLVFGGCRQAGVAVSRRRKWMEMDKNGYHSMQPNGRCNRVLCPFIKGLFELRCAAGIAFFCAALNPAFFPARLRVLCGESLSGGAARSAVASGRGRGQHRLLSAVKGGSAGPKTADRASPGGMAEICRFFRSVAYIMSPASRRKRFPGDGGFGGCSTGRGCGDGESHIGLDVLGPWPQWGRESPGYPPQRVINRH